MLRMNASHVFSPVAAAYYGDAFLHFIKFLLTRIYADKRLKHLTRMKTNKTILDTDLRGKKQTKQY